MLLPVTIMVPVALEFFTEMNATTIHEALQRGLRAVFSKELGSYFWVTVLIANFFMFAFIRPVYPCWSGMASCRQLSRAEAEKGMFRLDSLGPIVIFVSILASILTTLLPQADAAAQAAFFSVPLVYTIAESAVTGFMMGAILWVSVENALFNARQNLLMLFPDLIPRKSSLYGKVTVLIAAMVLFMMFQAFAISGNFFSKGMDMNELLAAVKAGQTSQPGGMNMLARAEEMKTTLHVFYIRTAAFMFFMLELLWSIKIMMTRPLVIIHDRLKKLNVGASQNDLEIQVVNNDEYAAVYKEINQLIKRQQSELAVSKDQLQRITEGAADPIIVFDGDGMILRFNPAAQQTFGVPEAEACSKRIVDVMRLQGSANPLLASAQNPEGLVRFKATDGNGRVLDFEAHTSKADFGDHVEHTVVLRDISAQLELEAGLRKARQEAETANHMKSEFLATMSHELRTPLNAVLGFSQLLSSDKNLTTAQLEKIDTINRSGEHLLGLINDILDISKIEAGKMELHETVFDLVQFVRDIQDMFELKCRKKGLSLYIEPTGDLPRYVEGDLGKLRQVVINLVGNAVKFTSEGGIGLTVGLDGGLYRFSVTDSGKGIPADEIQQILEPFVQSSLTDNEGGTGLGLAISTRFIAMMGGTLEVTSEVGKGSTFSFTVRLTETDRRPETEQENAVPVAVKEGHSVPILIVDDKTTNRLVLKEMLESVGFVTIEAENGKEAVERARQFKPAAVLMDIRMPVMDGYQAVRLIKDDPALSAIKVFALTASAFRHDEDQIKAAGFDGFLAKPFKQGALFALLRDKTDIQLVYESAPADAGMHVVDPDSLDYRKLSALFKADELESIRRSVLINDFAAVTVFAEQLRTRSQELAGLLAQYASSFDEEGLSKLMEKLGDTNV